MPELYKHKQKSYSLFMKYYEIHYSGCIKRKKRRKWKTEEEKEKEDT